MNPCKDGNHSLMTINAERVPGYPACLAITQWCKYCGAIVMDREIDGRTSPGYYMKMQFPEIAKQFVIK